VTRKSGRLAGGDYAGEEQASVPDLVDAARRLKGGGGGGGEEEEDEDEDVEAEEEEEEEDKY
jgi:hypothetical protein